MSPQSVAAMQTGTQKMIESAEQSLMYVVTRPGQVMVRGRGSYIWDAEGNRYLDFIQGWAVNCLGHCPPVLVRAINQQARELVNGSPSLYNDRMIELGRLLTENSALDKVFFCSTGAEANEGALKLARKYGAKHLRGAFEVVTTWHSFHGRTLAMMSASGKSAWDGLFDPKVPGFSRVPFNDLKAMEKTVSSRTCAIMVEPVQGEGGVNVASKAYMKGLRKLCDERGILLILDEVQTGIGRTGSLFGYSNFDIEPDIMTLGKGLGSGFPVAALLAKDSACVFEAGDQGSTYSSQPLAMAAGAAVVNEMIKRKIPKRAKTRGNSLMRKLKAMREEFGFTDVRGMGLLVGVDLATEVAPQVVAQCFEKGLLINAPGPKTIRFMPALTVSTKEVDEMLEIFTGVLRDIS